MADRFTKLRDAMGQKVLPTILKLVQEHERTILRNDPRLAIDWPLSGEPVLSRKDREGRLLAEAELFQ